MVNLVGMANMLDQNGLMQQVGVKMLDNALEVQEEQKSIEDIHKERTKIH